MFGASAASVPCQEGETLGHAPHRSEKQIAPHSSGLDSG